MPDAAGVLRHTLEEEKRTVELLNQLAEGDINRNAVMAAE